MAKFTIKKSGPKSKQNDTLVVFVSLNKDKPNLQNIPKDLKPLIEKSFKNKMFKGKVKEARVFPEVNIEGHSNIVLIGLGEKKKQNHECTRMAASSMYSQLKAYNLNKVDILVENFKANVVHFENCTQAFVQGIELTAYSFDDYKSKKNID